jgi:hypothetical protein
MPLSKEKSCVKTFWHILMQELLLSCFETNVDDINTHHLRNNTLRLEKNIQTNVK